MDPNDARLLPRYRPVGVVELRARARSQASVLLGAMARDEHATLPVRHAHSAVGGEELRGIPAIGRSVQGVIRGTDPAGEAERRISRLESIRERTELAA
jgi:hypothetical protein